MALLALVRLPRGTKFQIWPTIISASFPRKGVYKRQTESNFKRACDVNHKPTVPDLPGVFY